MLVTVFLIVKVRCSQSRCEEPGSRRSTSDVGSRCPTTKLTVGRSDLEERLTRFLLSIARDRRLVQSQTEYSEEVQRL